MGHKLTLTQEGNDLIEDGIKSISHPSCGACFNAHYGELRGFPGSKAADEIDTGGDAVPLQEAGGNRRAIAALAMQHQRRLAWYFLQASWQLIERHIQATSNVLALPFPWGTHIQNYWRCRCGQLLGQGGHRDARGEQ